MKHFFIAFLLLLALSPVIIVCPGDTTILKRIYTTHSMEGESISLDGLPDEDAWNLVEWSDNFIQHEPHEGKAPSQPTAFKILYDNNFLYLAYRCAEVSAD